MVEVSYTYDQQAKHQKLTKRRRSLIHYSRRPSFAGSPDDYTPFGGSGNPARRKELLGDSVWPIHGSASGGGGEGDTSGGDSSGGVSSEQSPEVAEVADNDTVDAVSEMVRDIL